MGETLLFTCAKKEKFLQMISLRSPRLSQKEITCVELLLQGKTAKEIAQCTGLSYRTIETRIHNLKVKFNAQNKSELIVKLLS